ncbi:DinB family protein [Kribbella italica]|uniref:Putative damage-inducible protein DinB n=1 Tax=Kribbella italica TaxID=1540520 RepID=A0A7W9J8J4_9ACTN|nr:DinB family protein [Kribbella italica]MBB5837102.1 putative damage-inducible protein DinB [Kribbella italica]
MDLKAELHQSLRTARATNLQKAAGLSEYDLRRPITPSGTNVLGVLKHLGGMEYGYLGGAFGRDLDREIPGDEDLLGGADMWARPDETSAYILDWYHQTCTNADRTIELHALDSPGWVEHFTPGHQTTTLAAMILRVLNEELRHGGHLDILRELLDGTTSPSNHPVDTAEYLAKVRAAAEAFAPAD